MLAPSFRFKVCVYPKLIPISVLFWFGVFGKLGHSFGFVCGQLLLGFLLYYFAFESSFNFKKIKNIIFFILKFNENSFSNKKLTLIYYSDASWKVRYKCVLYKTGKTKWLCLNMCIYIVVQKEYISSMLHILRNFKKYNLLSCTFSKLHF